MLTAIARFEARYHAGRPAFAAAAALFALLGFALTASGFGPDNLPVGAPFLVAESLAFVSLLSVFAAAVFVSDAILRDAEHRMDGIVYSTPVGRFDFLAGRFAGAFSATLAAVSCSAVGMAVASLMPWLDPERAGRLGAPAVAWALLTVTLPNVLFVTAVLFAVAALTRSALATYAAAVCVYALYLVASALTDSPLMAASSPGAGGGLATALLDPFGLSAFFAETRYWTAAEKASRMVGLGGVFLANRAAWIAVAVAIAAVTLRRFSFRAPRAPRRAKTERRTDVGAAARAVPYAPVAPDAAPAHAWLAAFASAAALEVRILLRSVPFLLLLVLWTALAVVEIRSDVLDGEYGSSSYPATSLILAAVGTPLSLVGTILLLYYAAEVFWREQRFRFASVADATPVRSTAVVAAKCAALAAIVVCLVVCAAAAGVGVQASRGYARVEPALYISLLVFRGLPLALTASAFALIHTLSPGKYAGMVFTLLFAVVAQRGDTVGLEHHLWRFASAPPVPYSEMNGFGGHVAPFAWYMVVWTLVALAMSLGAARLWRSLGASVGERLRVLGRARSGSHALAAGLAALTLLSGGWVFVSTRVIGGEMSRSAALDWRESYERRNRFVASIPQPSVDSIEADVELYPGERRYHASGRLGLVNRTSEPVRDVYAFVSRDARRSALDVPGARFVAPEAASGPGHFELAAPLAPGGRAELRFDVTFAVAGFADGEQDDTIVDNGSFVDATECFPWIGYRAGYEISDPRERRRRGLPEPTNGPAEGDAADVDTRGVARVRFAVTLSTAADQMAVGPGRLDAAWSGADGRRYFRYVSDAPTLDMLGFASARYAVDTREHDGVEVAVYRDPAHGANVARMLDTAEASLDVFTREFGPYPHAQLKIVEVPTYWRFGAFAMPDTIFFVEDRGFLTDARDPDPVDLVARRTAHEIAHQWWGHQLAPADGPGATVLVESLTKYSEMLVLERMYGEGQVRRLLEIELDRYLAGRSGEERSEPPLVEAGNRAYLYYSKGAVVLWAVRDIVGEEAMNRVLRELLEAHAGRDGTATSAKLVAALVAAAPERDRATILSWFESIVVYDLKVESASAERRDDGRYDVTVRVAASRSLFDGSGNESPLPLDEEIRIGAFAGESTLHAAKHELRDGANEIHFVVDSPPDRVAVDPDVSRVDRNRFDNEKRVSTPAD